MDVGQVSASTAAVTAVLRELQAINEMQMAIMKSISDSQQQMTAMLQAAGIGANVDVRA
jgi:hypothetical protein